MLAATTGPLDLREFEGLFDQHTPNDAADWIDDLAKRTLAEPRLSFDTILGVLTDDDFDNGATSASVIVDRLKHSKVLPRVGAVDRYGVLAVFKGLSVLVPDLVRVEENREFIYFGASPTKLREAVQRQVERVPADFRYGVDVPHFRNSGARQAPDAE